MVAAETKGEFGQDTARRFASTTAMRESARSDAYARTRADEANFIAPGELPFIITREHVVVA